jgi:hypothetical protein
MLTVDLLHEIELGTLKSLFTHLVQILYAASIKLPDNLVVCLESGEHSEPTAPKPDAYHLDIALLQPLVKEEYASFQQIHQK